MAKKSTEYLSYIEETPKHHDKIAELAKAASKKAVKEADKKKLSITYLKGDRIIERSVQGHEKEVGTYPNHRRKVAVGSKSSLSKK